MGSELQIKIREPLAAPPDRLHTGPGVNTKEYKRTFHNSNINTANLIILPDYTSFWEFTGSAETIIGLLNNIYNS